MRNFQPGKSTTPWFIDVFIKKFEIMAVWMRPWALLIDWIPFLYISHAFLLCSNARHWGSNF